MGKCKSARRSLRFAGQFERRCRCLLHNDAEPYTSLYRTAGKEFEKRNLNEEEEEEDLLEQINIVYIHDKAIMTHSQTT